MKRKKVYLIGVGMGNVETLTAQARRIIDSCEILLGAPRLLEPFGNRHAVPMILTEEIAEFVQRGEFEPIGVLLSGDVGFYSGASSLRERLGNFDVESIPGISALSYFCARLGVPWQDVNVVSVHGRDENYIGSVQSSHRTFLLTGGKLGVAEVCRELTGGGLGDVSVTVGERLSYVNERIIKGPAELLAEESFGGLAVMLIENRDPVCREFISPGIPDSRFQRGNVPMTKEEVRTLIISKLRLRPDEVMWDVGAGTGSVSVECAMALGQGQVFAVEKNPEAILLLKKNREKFGVRNLTIVEGTAPEVLNGLPEPGKLFLGGTSGKLHEILDFALEINRGVRFVLTAITLETLGAALDFINHRPLRDIDIVQISVTRTKSVTSGHMALAENPVWIVSGEGDG